MAQQEFQSLEHFLNICYSSEFDKLRQISLNLKFKQFLNIYLTLTCTHFMHVRIYLKKIELIRCYNYKFLTQKFQFLITFNLTTPAKL